MDAWRATLSFCRRNRNPYGGKISSTFGLFSLSTLYGQDLQGTVETTHKFDRLLLHDVAVTPDEQRYGLFIDLIIHSLLMNHDSFLAVATLEKSAHGLVPSKSRHEKRIIGITTFPEFLTKLPKSLTDVLFKSVQSGKQGH